MNEEFDFIPYGSRRPSSSGPFRVTAREVVHPVTAYALRVEAGGRTLAYSGDSGVCPGLEDTARDADLFLCEASFLEGAPNPPDLHLTGAEAGRTATGAGSQRLLLTHIPPWHDPAGGARRGGRGVRRQGRAGDARHVVRRLRRRTRSSQSPDACRSAEPVGPVRHDGPADHARERHQALRTVHRRRRRLLRRAAGEGDRLPRTQRRRQVDQHARHGRVSRRRTAGAAPIGGHLYSEIPNPARHVGVLLDASAQHAGRTGREVLRLSAETMGVGSARVEEMLELVGLSGTEAKRRVRNYSLGMRQRLGIANALHGRPLGADPRRAGQRPRPRRHPLDARPAAQLRRPGRHGAAVLAPAPRGRDDRRRDGAHRPRQDRRAGHQGGAARRRPGPT